MMVPFDEISKPLPVSPSFIESVCDYLAEGIRKVKAVFQRVSAAFVGLSHFFSSQDEMKALMKERREVEKRIQNLEKNPGKYYMKVVDSEGDRAWDPSGYQNKLLDCYRLLQEIDALILQKGMANILYPVDNELVKVNSFSEVAEV